MSLLYQQVTIDSKKNVLQRRICSKYRNYQEIRVGNQLKVYSKCNGKLWYSNINRFCNSTCSEVSSKIRSNLTWHSNMLKMMYLPEKHPQKAEIAAREERTQETTKKTSIPSEGKQYCAHPREIDTTIVAETSVPDACLNILAVSCVVTSASAGSRGQFSFRMTQSVNFVMFFLVVD